MNFSSIEGLLCGMGFALLAYSRTFPAWLYDRAMERYYQARETIEVMEAKLAEYEKAKAMLGEIEVEAKKEGVMPTKKESLDFKLRLINEFTRRNDELLMAAAKMKVAREAVEECRKEMNRRRKDSAYAFWAGGVMLLWGVVLFARK